MIARPEGAPKRPYSEREITQIRRLAEVMRMDDSDIGRIMGRSEKSIYQIRHKRGIRRVVTVMNAPTHEEKVAAYLEAPPCPTSANPEHRRVANMIFLLALTNAGHKPGVGQLVIESDGYRTRFESAPSVSYIGSSAAMAV